ncbi:MAG: ATP-binding cassette domain-containing protein, partial [Granulosicoccus sp.]
VVIAIAIACQPRLLIADEPTTALDVTTQAGILDLLRSLQREQGLALILITHDLAVVSSIADRIAVMNSGRVVETGMINEVFSNPRHDYTKLLFAASALSQVSAGDRDIHAGEVSNQSLENRPDLLSVTDLVCEYRTPRRGWFAAPGSFRAVDTVSFTVREGECLGLVGESGCGKSTLTLALLGLLPLHSGSVVLRGERVSDERAVTRSVRQQMQVVFQDPYGSFNPRHRVRRLIAEPLHVLDREMSDKQIRSRVDELLEHVGMQASDSTKYIHEFSGGQRQRIAIARALIISPALIILDEAVSALDVSVRAQIIDLLHTLAREHSLAYLFISHDLSVVRRVTERVMVMQKGRIIEQGRTQEVFDYPSHEYTQQLVKAVPTLNLPE